MIGAEYLDLMPGGAFSKRQNPFFAGRRISMSRIHRQE
jgi:hypothetical protein